MLRLLHRAAPGPGRDRDRGAAAVEMALLLPLVLLLVCGIVDMGRMLNVQISLSAAAREGARWAALGQSGVPARVALSAPGVTPAPSVTVSPSTCTGQPVNTAVTVVATSTYTMITPVAAISALFGGGFPGTVTLTGRGVMRCGG